MTQTTKKYTPLQSSFLSKAIVQLSNDARSCKDAINTYPLHDASQHKHDWTACYYAVLEGMDALQKVIDQEQFNG